MSVDVSKVLREEKIEVRSIKFGNQYALCPQCSHMRKGAHKKIKCLSVKIDAERRVLELQKLWMGWIREC